MLRRQLTDTRCSSSKGTVAERRVHSDHFQHSDCIIIIIIIIIIGWRFGVAVTRWSRSTQTQLLYIEPG